LPPWGSSEPFGAQYGVKQNSLARNFEFSKTALLTGAITTRRERMLTDNCAALCRSVEQEKINNINVVPLVPLVPLSEPTCGRRWWARETRPPLSPSVVFLL
jgi:hypothetical protein